MRGPENVELRVFQRIIADGRPKRIEMICMCFQTKTRECGRGLRDMVVQLPNTVIECNLS